ncbi:MAG: hypothetical protein AB1768_00115 [Pseudomonadota bacterium]|jgi:hypothetical protein
MTETSASRGGVTAGRIFGLGIGGAASIWALLVVPEIVPAAVRGGWDLGGMLLAAYAGRLAAGILASGLLLGLVAGLLPFAANRRPGALREWPRNSSLPARWSRTPKKMRWAWTAWWRNWNPVRRRTAMAPSRPALDM